MNCRPNLILSRPISSTTPGLPTPRLSTAFLSAALLSFVTILGQPASASAVERAYLIHGGDRTLASVGTPSGPATLNLDTVGLFPSEMVRYGTHAWVPCGGSDQIDVVDLANDVDPDPPSILTGAGTNPYGIAFASGSKAYVSLLLTGSVVPVDPATGSVGAPIPVGRSPQGVLAASGKIFVANTGFDFSTFGYDPGTVSVIDTATDAVIATLPVGMNPQALALAPNGEVHVVCTGDYFSAFGRVFIIDPVSVSVIDSLDIGGSPGFIAINSSGIGYLSDYFLGLLSYHAATRVPLRDASDPIPVGTGAAGVDFDQAGRTYAAVYGDDQLIVLNSDDTLLGAVPVGDGPQDVVLFDTEEPVAVTLAGFTAVVDGNDVSLRWQTSNEFEHVGFRIERAMGTAGAWHDRGWVASGVTSDGRYAFLDRGAFSSDGDTRLLYRLVALDRSGGAEALAPLVVIRPDGGSSVGLQLGPPSPNPLRSGVTQLAFRLGAPGSVVLTIHDPAGREVARPLSRTLDAGDHRLDWDGRTDDGQELAQGVYFIRLSTPVETRTGRIVLAR